jgi:iron-sulfur cluster repair protein YtfE (RIC family)
MMSAAGEARLRAMAQTLSEPLRQRNAALRMRLGGIGELAARIEHLDHSERQRAVDAVLDVLRDDFHLDGEAEELFLLPRVARQLRHPLATAAMEFDQQLLQDYADALTGADPRNGRGLERLLYAIWTLLDAHLRKEEAVYAPLLEYDGAARR